MKTITISTENSETYSSISNFFIDYYMTEANGEFVKVYLYLVRLLNSNSKISVAEIADHFNLTEKDICRAIKYWISRDVIKLNYDGKGHLNGIVLLPLHNPQNELVTHESDIISFLRDDVDSDNTKDIPVSANKSENVSETVKEAAIIPMPSVSDIENEPETPPKPKFTKDIIDDMENDEDWMDILYQVETLFGKTISARDMQTLLYIYETLNFNVDLFEYLIEYCTTMEKKNCRYMEAVAIAWYKEGIKTRKEAKEKATYPNELVRMVYRTLGLRSRMPNSIEIDYVDTWTKKFGFSEDMIKYACEKALIISPASVNFPYLNAIFENWYKNGVHNKDDVERLDREYMSKKKPKASSKPVAKVVNGFNSFEQKKLDDELDEMEELFLNEVNKK